MILFQNGWNVHKMILSKKLTNIPSLKASFPH